MNQQSFSLAPLVAGMVLLLGLGTGCGSAAPAEANDAGTVLVTVPSPSDSDRAEVESKKRQNAEGSPEAQLLVGSWVEQWEGRMGCEDEVRISTQGGRLRLRGQDCNDGEEYEFDSEEFDGKRLTFFLTVRSTNVRIRYELFLQNDDTLIGQATGDSQGDVVWHRLR